MKGGIAALRKGRVPGGADLVTYWFEKARAQIDQGRARLAGLVATNSIRGGQNRKVLERIRQTGVIFDAWDDEPWINEGAAVRVSLVSFAGVSGPAAATARFDGQPVKEIYADLTTTSGKGCSTGTDLTQARQLPENEGFSFIGTQKTGPFDVSGEQARDWLNLPGNPSGRPNSDVVKPWANGMDVARRPSDTWTIDFGSGMSEQNAALYERPFEFVAAGVKPARAGNRNPKLTRDWWLFEKPRQDMRNALTRCPRYIATPRVAKHRLFTWMHRAVLPDCQLVVVARADDETFGILHSRFHELWALRLGTSLEDRPRYTPTTTFETFPFPEGLTANLAPEHYTNPAAPAIAEAARALVRLRDNWLNPPEWVKRVPEVVPGYPDRLLPVDEKAAAELKKRTLTNLYNQRPAWLANAHRALDEAVAVAYGWPADIADDEILKRLLGLNLRRAERH